MRLVKRSLQVKAAIVRAKKVKANKFALFSNFASKGRLFFGCEERSPQSPDYLGFLGHD